MIKQTLPTIIGPDTSPSPRKVSQQNLDSLYSGVILILNLHPCKWSPEVQAHISALHNRVMIDLDHDAYETIAYLKAASRYFAEYLRGNILTAEAVGPNYWDPQTDSPKYLQPLLDIHDVFWADSEVNRPDGVRMIQCIYAMLSGHRVIVVNAKPNYSTITGESTLKGHITLDNIPEACSALGITPEAFQKEYRGRCEKFIPHILTTAGPNGQATWSANLDARAVMSDRALMAHFRQFADLSNLTFILASMHSVVAVPDELSKPRGGKPVTGRLHTIEEWGGKARIVAIVDYWSQMLLTPLHDTVAHFLSMIPMDGTFDQEKIIQKVREWVVDKDTKVYSYDLTAATDRLPICIQRDILTYLTGSEALASAWMGVMSDREFARPDMLPPVRYEVGQPMGAKSSFPMLGLTHHVIVQSAALRGGVKDFAKYVLLGDDMTLGMQEVSINYLYTMRRLGVPINLGKSYIPVEGAFSAGEICKRTFITDFELSALPVKTLVKAARFGYMGAQLQNELTVRKWPISRDHFFAFMANVIDIQSMKGLILLNAAPKAVTGITDPIKSTATHLEISSWFKGIPLKEQDVIDAHTFSLICDQLKRVDQLLRGTLNIAGLIGASVVDPTPGVDASLCSGMTEIEVKQLLAKLPKMSSSHPIVFASQNELQRVMTLLSQLRAGTPEMVSAARRGLLDLLRNSLTDIWMDENEKKSAVTRSAFNSMLSSLTRMCTKTDPTDRRVNFSILLTSIQRNWTVDWRLGHGVYLNVVKSKINTSAIDAVNKLQHIQTDINISNTRV